MRSDMSQVLTDQPRRGHRDRNRKSGMRINTKEVTSILADDFDGIDFGPSHLPMTTNDRGARDGKERSSHASPLERFLRSKVGRPWNSVHSEISKQLDNRSFARGRNVWDHLRYMVTTDCTIGKDGLAYDSRWNNVPLRGLYVHPKTRLLRYQHVPQPKYPRNAFKEKLRERFGINAGVEYLPMYRIVDDYTVLEFKSGCWFIQQYAYLEPNDVVRVEWSDLGKRRTIYQRDEPHIKHFRLKTCRQMSKKQLKQYAELINQVPA